MYKTFASLLLCLCMFAAFSQEAEFDFNKLTDLRKSANARGRIAYSTYSLVNIGTSIAGFALIAPSGDAVTRPILLTNAAWGIIQGAAVLAAKKRANAEENADFESAFKNYEDDLSRYRGRVFLDIGMMAGGTVLAALGKEGVVQGIGLSTAAQGVILIIIDGIMYASHNAKMMKWAKAMRVHTSANSVGIVYSF